MRVRVAVPVAVFGVSYEVRAGRPYSSFERLVLKAVVEGTTRLQDLEGIFGVHRRVLVEAVVTLVHAGWIALGGIEGDLVATPAGRRATAETTPSTVTVHRPPPARVLMEQFHGELVPASATSYRVLPPEARDEVLVVPRKTHRPTLEPGEVQYLLPHRSGEWVSWIDPDIQLMSSGIHFVVAEIDTERGVVHNLPDPFLRAIEPALTQAYGHGIVLRRADLSDTPDSEVRGRNAWYADVAADSLIVGATDHAAIIDKAFDTATSRVVVASAFLGDRAATRLAPKVAGALLRGVDVDLVWGYEGEAPTSDARARLRAAEEQAKSLRGTGTLSINERPAGSHMKVLLWDDGNTWNTVLGSFNWLSAHASAEDVDISLKVKSPGVGAAVLRHLADTWAQVDSTGARVARTWSALAGRLESDESTTTPSADAKRLSLVYGRSHELELRNALRNSQQRLVISSHKMGSVGVARLGAGEGRQRPDSFRGVVIVAELLDNLSVEAARAACDRAGLTLLHRAIHGKVLVSDETVLVGSYNFLSADIEGTGSRIKELSLKVEHPGLPSNVLERLAGLPRR
jgi:phosphatidylserine/phosphatidylglycerophosphate/cardiolipin synthase-like enzyme